MCPNQLRDRYGCPFHPIGVNYWPRRTAVEMWTRWDPESIAQDWREMRALGLNPVRFFLMTADFADAEAHLMTSSPCARRRINSPLTTKTFSGIIVIAKTF